DGAFLVMRWLRGGNLHDLLHNRPLPTELLGRLIEQVGSALAVAHRRGVVHRDLKPANILLDEEGNAYLADFGIAKDMGTRVSPYQTDATTVVGSPAYISPEQIRAEPITPQTDIYSLGVMLFEILTGQLPFHAPTPIALMFMHMNEPVPTVRTQRPDLSDAVNLVIQKATAKRPADRYADVTTLIKDLRQALASGPAVTARLADPQPTPSPAEPGNRTTGDSRRRSTYETGVLYLPVPLATPIEEEIENPYKGLRAFQEADAGDFFGRELLTQLLLTRMQEQVPLGRFLAVVGPSGSGKSSVVRAGLVPAIRRGGLPGSQNWFVVEMFPSAHPIQELAQALIGIAVEPPNNLIEPLMLDDQGLLRVIDQVVPGADETEVVLVIDQFEEVFTLVEDEAERTHFLNSLINAVTDPYSRIRVIVTLRADFYDRPLLYPGFSELMRQRTEVVVPLAPEELKQAIISPAERNGLRVDPELVEAIVDDVAEQPGALPLLQYALTEVFERRAGHTLTLTPYNASGGVLGALARRAEEIYTGLRAEQQEAAHQLFLRLVTLGEGVEDTRRRVRRTELATMTKAERRTTTDSGNPTLSALVAGPSLELDHVIATYGQYRLLTLDNDPATRLPTVEVAHEALIRTWTRLRQWLDASRDDLRLQRRMTAAAAEWLASERDRSFLASGARLEQLAGWADETHLALNAEEREYLSASLAEREAQQAQEDIRKHHEAMLERRSRTFLQALVGVALLAAVVGIGLSIFAFGQRRAALEQQQLALDKQQLALQSANIAATAEARAQSEAERAKQQESLAQTSAQEAKHNANDATNLALSAGVEKSLLLGNADAAMTLAVAANDVPNPLPQAQFALSEAAYPPGTRLFFRGHKSQVWDIAICSDGKTALTASRDKTLILWDIASGKQLQVFQGHTGVVRKVAFSPDCRKAVSAAQDKSVILWDIASGQALHTLAGHTDEVHAVAFSPDGKTVLSGSDDTTMKLWDATTGALIHTFTGHTQAIGGVAYSPDGTTAVSGSDDQTLILWDLVTKTQKAQFTGPALSISSVAFSPNGQTILSGSDDGTLRLWDVATGKPLTTFTGHKGGVISVAFSPDGKLAASGADDNLVGIWNIETGQPITFLSGHGSSVRGVAFTPDGLHVLSASGDSTARLWDIANGAQIQSIAEPAGVQRAVFSADGANVLLGLGDKNNTMQLQNLASGKTIQTFSGHNDVVKDVAISPDGKTALSGSSDGFMIWWDVATGAFLKRFGGTPDTQIYSVAFSPDGKTALSGGSGENTMVWWDLIKGTAIMSYTDHTDSINSVLFTPDGTAGLTVSSDKTMVLWELATGKQLHVFKGHTAKIRDAVFNKDATQLLSASEDRKLILWDVATAKIIRTFLVEHIAAIWAVALSPDGTLAASGSQDNNVIVWDVATGQPLRRFKGHGGSINAVAFSPDGKAILSASGDRTVRLWRIDSASDMLAWAKTNRDYPALTCEDARQYRLDQSKCEISEQQTAP
ncbi:MAG: protein kinase, partial [Roseiflexaceae bacterium]